MAERVTIANVREAEDNLNRRLEVAGSRFRVEVERRYDYCAVDEMQIDERGVWAPYGPIVAGTKRECYDALRYMMRGIDWSTNYRTPSV